MRKITSWPWLLVLGLAWLALFKALGAYGVWLIPEAIRRELTLESYLTIVQLVTLVVGVGLSALLVENAWEFLGFTRASSRSAAEGVRQPRTLVTWCVFALLLAPAAYALTHATAVQIAVPTLLEEIRRGGRALAQSSTGQFGRELVSLPLWLTLSWGALVSPLCEELLFRGALWSALEKMWRSLLGGRLLLTGTLTTLLVTLIFAALHLDMPGGLGIVRAASAVGLALACGFMRQASRHVLPAILLHVGFNVISILGTRHVLDAPSLGKWLWVPAPIWLIAIGGLTVLAIAYAVQKLMK